MAKLMWDKIGERFFELGTSNTALFVQGVDGKFGKGVAWSGMQAVKQAPEGAEVTKIYADNQEYAGLESAEKFKDTIEAFMYPDEFMQCDGTAEVAPGVYVGQQRRVPFAMVYKTLIGSDTAGIDAGYKLHFIWNAKVAPSAKDYTTIGETPEATALSWAFDTTTMETGVEGLRPMAYFVVDSTKVSTGVMKQLEGIVYGTEAAEAKMPELSEVIAIAKGGTAGRSAG